VIRPRTLAIRRRAMELMTDGWCLLDAKRQATEEVDWAERTEAIRQAEAMPPRTPCIVCGGTMEGRRRHARVCSPRCHGKTRHRIREAMNADRRRRGLLTAEQVGKVLGYDGTAIRHWASIGIIPSHGEGVAAPGRARLFDLGAVAAVLPAGYVSASAIARGLNVPPQVIGLLAREGHLPAVRLGECFVFDPLVVVPIAAELVSPGGRHAMARARQIKRERALRGAWVEPVDREVVAARDGWRCCICGGRVTRDTWSLDHIVPLSQGGEHSYRNVALAHVRCNSRRHTGRLPSQAPLFAKVA
jgi:hypothetical protein